MTAPPLLAAVAVAMAAVAAAAAAACQDPAPRAAAGASSAAAAPTAAGPNPAAGEPAVRRGPPQVVVLDEPAIALPHQESFQLIDAGKGARSALRYTLAPGATTLIARTELLSRHVAQGGFTAPVALPAIRDGFEVAITADRPGRLALRAVPGQAAAASPAAEAYLAPGRMLENRAITVEVDDRGAIRSLGFDDDPGGARSAAARDVLAQSLLTLVVPVPAEPIGSGARWSSVTILRQGPAVAKQTATYTLLARTPRRWKLHVKLQRVGESQQLADPSLPRGTTTELIALFRILEGDIEVDPRLPVVAGGGLTIESRLHARIHLPAPEAATGGAARPAATIEQMFEDTGRVSFSRAP